MRGDDLCGDRRLLESLRSPESQGPAAAVAPRLRGKVSHRGVGRSSRKRLVTADEAELVAYL
jgi:hypothetical protein